MNNFLESIQQFEEFPLDDELLYWAESIVAVMGEPDSGSYDSDDYVQFVDMSWQQPKSCRYCIGEDEQRMLSVTISSDDKILCEKTLMDYSGEQTVFVPDDSVNFVELKEWLERGD